MSALARDEGSAEFVRATERLEGEQIKAEQFDGADLEGWDESRCVACGELIDYCMGHGTMGDPEGAAVLAWHDLEVHTLCDSRGCEFAGEGQSVRRLRLWREDGTVAVSLGGDLLTLRELFGDVVASFPGGEDAPVGPGLGEQFKQQPLATARELLGALNPWAEFEGSWELDPLRLTQVWRALDGVGLEATEDNVRRLRDLAGAQGVGLDEVAPTLETWAEFHTLSEAIEAIWGDALDRAREALGEAVGDEFASALWGPLNGDAWERDFARRLNEYCENIEGPYNGTWGPWVVKVDPAGELSRYYARPVRLG